MDRHRPRLHHPTQGSAAGTPYPSAASLRSCRESKVHRRKGPQLPPLPGGTEEPGEKRPKFVSFAWSWGWAAPALQTGWGSILGYLNIIKLLIGQQAWVGPQDLGAKFWSRFAKLPVSL